ncbi:hypothetical protein ACQ859_18590 [Roseateles chitinivorans]|uniref:hypothetical protein n=1 Tax=Roseateles chitinivorans TaxID=2917965 RepID=UPI003D671105
MTSTRHSAQVEWVITLSPEVIPAEAGRALEKAGLRVDQVLEAIGVITGRGTQGLGEALRRVNGVADVSEQAPIDIGPPDSSVS